MSWMAALNIRACGGVFIVVVLRIGLQLRGHDDEGDWEVYELGNTDSMVHMKRYIRSFDNNEHLSVTRQCTLLDSPGAGVAALAGAR